MNKECNNLKERLDKAKKLGEELKEKLGKGADVKKNQLRKILSAVNILRNKKDFSFSSDFKYLKAKIAYQVGKMDKYWQKKAFKELYDGIFNRFKAINSKEEFDEFAKFIEVIVSYFYFHESQQRQDCRHTNNKKSHKKTFPTSPKT